MANGSSRQNFTTSPASQVRRSSRNTRDSVSRSSGQRRSHSSRSGSIRNFDEALSRFLDENDIDISNLPNDSGFDFSFPDGEYGQDDSYNDPLAFSQTNGQIPNGFFPNSNVAVPSTPHAMRFPEAVQQLDPTLGYQAQQIPQTPQYYDGVPVVSLNIGGQTIMMQLTEDQANLAFGAVGAAMMGDGKRISIPKSPGLTGQASNHPGQVGHVDSSLGQHEFVNFPQVDNVDSGYPEPTDYSITQPYYATSYQHTQNNHPFPNNQVQGAASPGLRSTRRFLERVGEQSNLKDRVSKIFQDLVSLVNDANQQNLQALDPRSSSASTYTTRNSSSRSSREDSLHRLKKTRRNKSQASLDKRVSVFANDANGQYQRPKIADFNPEVRINKTTKGLTTRTGKINEYDPRRHYTYTMHPLGTQQQPEGADWQGRHYVHKYNDASTRDQKSGEKTIAIYEFEDRAMPADKIRDFILSYPKHNKLTLRIQVAPGDSGRRYKKGADKCRFAECPARNGGQNRTIKHGFYRIAFDERGDDEEYDPFAACCGFAHLYCMERFLDFEYICRKANVVVDTRVQMRREPKGQFASALSGKQAEAAEIADAFIRAARNKPQGIRREQYDGLGVRQLPMFAEYPIHRYPNDDTWDPTYPYEHTLGYHMFRITEGHRAYAQLTQFAAGGLGPTKITVHRGDVGLFVEHYVQEKENNPENARLKKKGKRNLQSIRYNDPSYVAEVNRRVERAQAVMTERAKSQPRKSKKQSVNTRKTLQQLEVIDEYDENDDYQEGWEPWAAQDDESDGDFDQRPPRKGVRNSKRITGKRPIDYRDDPDDNRNYGRQPRESKKRKLSEHASSPKMQQNYSHLNRHGWQNTSHNSLQDTQQVTPNRPSSGFYAGYQPANSYQLDAGQLPLDYQNNDQDVDNSDLGHLDLSKLNASPRSSTGKRKRSSESNKEFGGDLDELFFEDTPASARPTKRLRSGASDQRQGLHRRPSSTVSSIMRRPSSRRSSGTKRHASFNVEPVSRQKRFNSNAPPQHVRSRMVKELQTDLTRSSQRSKEVYPPARTLRSGRSVSFAFD